MTTENLVLLVVGVGLAALILAYDWYEQWKAPAAERQTKHAEAQTRKNRARPEFAEAIHGSFEPTTVLQK